MNDDEVFQKLQRLIGASMALPPERVSLQSRLVADLGVDSLDFLDILFQIEKSFQVELQAPEIYGTLLGRSVDADADVFLSDEEVAALRTWLPALASLPAGEKLRRKEAFSYVSVESLLRVLRRKLDGKP